MNKKLKIKTGKIKSPYPTSFDPIMAGVLVKNNESSVIKESDFPPLLSHSKTSNEKIYPVSLVQEVLLNGTKENGYQSPICFINTLAGPLNVAALKTSIEKIIGRHWILRTKFLFDECINCKVMDVFETDFFFEKDLRNIPILDLEDLVQEEIGRICSFEFIDISKPPLLRCNLLRVDDEEYFIVIKCPHLVFDAFSMNIFRNELEEMYLAQIENRSPWLPELPVQYVDYAIWERECDTKPKMIRKMEYWKKTLSGNVSANFLKDLQVPESANFVADPNDKICAVSGVIDAVLLDALKDFSRQHGWPLYNSILLATSVLLHSIGRKNDFLFHMGLSIRPPEASNLIGYFISSAPMRLKLENDLISKENMAQIKDRMIEVLVNQIPFSKFNEVQIGDREKEAFDHGATFTLNYVEGFKDPLNLSGIDAEYIERENFMDPGPGILLQLSQTKNNITYYFSYNPKFFKEETILNISSHFEAIFLQLARKVF